MSSQLRRLSGAGPGLLRSGRPLRHAPLIGTLRYLINNISGPGADRAIIELGVDGLRSGIFGFGPASLAWSGVCVRGAGDRPGVAHGDGDPAGGVSVALLDNFDSWDNL
jgi:hypothetical protein